jgi:hypothetical protein
LPKTANEKSTPIAQLDLFIFHVLVLLYCASSLMFCCIDVRTSTQYLRAKFN